MGIGVYIARTPDSENTSIGFDQVGDAHKLWSYQAHGDRPTLSNGESSRLPEVAGADSASGYAFTAVREDASPVTYDRCRRVEFVVGPAGAPQGYLDFLNDALAGALKASGLVPP